MKITSQLMKTVSKITSELYNEAKAKGVVGNLRRIDYQKEAWKIVKGITNVKVSTADLPIIPYRDFKGSILVNHANGSDGWWINNCIGAGKGNGSNSDDVDLRAYKKFEDGGYKDCSGKWITEKTTIILMNALYTNNRVDWHEQYAFNIPGKKIAYIEKYDFFVYIDRYDEMDEDTRRDFEEYVVGIKS